jgi:asparagine synthetase B (glutamine-hydrolysing)
MSQLSGVITVDPQNIIHQHFQHILEEKAYQAQGSCGTILSSQPIYAHQGIYFTGTAQFLKLNNQPLTPDELLTAWHQTGINTLQGLSGEFCFLICDTRQTLDVWAVRDHFGSVPLHYCKERSFFAFSQRARPLWNLPIDTVSTLNESRILDYIVDDLEHATHTATFRQNIHKVPLSGCVHWQINRITTHQYWKPDLTVTKPDITEKSALENYQSLLIRSISNKSGQSNATALLASGGLDSNSIHAAWKKTTRYTEGNNHLISLLPDKDNREDLECEMLMHEVSKDCPLPHNYITPGIVLRTMGPVESFVHQLEDPFTMHTLSGPAPCYKFASDIGVTHVMDGIDGDLVGGIPSRYWNYLWAGGEKKNAIFECILNHKHHEEPFSKSIKALIRMLLANHIPGVLRRLDSISSKKDWDREQATRWKRDLRIRDAAFTESFIQQRIALLRSNHPTPSCPSLGEYLHQGMLSPMLGVGIDRYEEAGHMFGLKPAHPILDKDLAEFLLGLPWRFRVKNGNEKSLFRLFLDQNHQKNIANQAKLPHVGPWFTLAYLRDYLIRNPKPKTECLDAVNRYVDATWLQTEWHNARHSNSMIEVNEDLWRMLMLGEWLVQNA